MSSAQATADRRVSFGLSMLLVPRNDLLKERLHVRSNRHPGRRVGHAIFDRDRVDWSEVPQSQVGH